MPVYTSEILSGTAIYKKNFFPSSAGSTPLTGIWTFGRAIIGSVTTGSAGYVARYSLKKRGKELCYSKDSDRPAGSTSLVKSEFIRMSRSPGLGYQWFQRYKDDCYPHSYVVMPTYDNRNIKVPVPRYFDKLYEQSDPIPYSIMKLERMAASLEAHKSFTLRNLLDFCENYGSRVIRLVRPFETSLDNVN